ncbi:MULTISPECIES: DUF2971 domain-containing protein [Mycobacterium]|uniref:DUF2971 domain-containing protein n=1 Tax=Mycobacterium colombiense TaxID=339268 RepID=A0A329L9K0_9MYCO|nr:MULTISPECIES: DUF2971 domain-containing protein [Mycobacterium]MDM4142510.1 DUF2971 domain-containing protein [Mycobacterium sp. FLAC0960]RAV03292.1 hypothetical protein DQP57_25335 [Mycobacterium colombiense]
MSDNMFKEDAAEHKVLYHYTDAGGLAAIVQQGLLRATDIRFLNDPLELRYAWEALLAALETAKAEKPEYSEAYDAALQAISMTNAIDPDAIEDRIFSTSFSENGDELGQWRSYADDAKGVALGFDKENITMLKVPYYYHTEHGQLVQMTAIEGGTNKQVPFTWGAFTQQVQYGDEARQRAIEAVLYQVEQSCGKNGEGRLSTRLFNVINQIPVWLSMLALVKKTTYQSEQEWRLTIAEHFGSSSLSIKNALSNVEEFKWAAQGPLQTVDVKFRPGGLAGFKPYTEIPFERSALVKVVIGPNVESRDKAVSTAKRLLQRYGYWHTEVVASEHEYRV